MTIFDTNPRLKRALLLSMRQAGWPTLREARRRLKEVDYAINERAGIQARIAAVQQHGRVQLVRSGMDCDCTQYQHSTTIDVPKSLVAFLKHEHEHEEWLDGPESTWFEEPDENYHKSADRALEAYEDGHPGVVYWGEL